MRRTIIATASAAALAICGVAGGAAGNAGAQQTANAGTAFVRAAHLSPDTPQVDVYLTAFRGGSTKLWLSGVGYGDVSPYRRIAAGQYAVSMRPHGAKATTPAALRWTLTLRAGTSYTAAAVGRQAEIHGIIVRDSLANPRAGQGSVRIVQAASTAPRVSVTAGGERVSGGASFGTVTRYVSVPAGDVMVRARSLTDSSLTGTRRVNVQAGSVTSLVLLDRRGGGLVLRPLTDAAGTRNTPRGSVETGGGGTARRDAGVAGGVAVLLRTGG